MSGSIDTVALAVGHKSLDALWERSNAISDNIANADTPGYQQKSVSFETELADALGDGRLTGQEVDGLQAAQTAARGGGTPDGSAVDMEQQITELMRNQLQYNYMERAVSDNLGLLKTAASDGRR